MATEKARIHTAKKSSKEVLPAPPKLSGRAVWDRISALLEEMVESASASVRQRAEDLEAFDEKLLELKGSKAKAVRETVARLNERRAALEEEIERLRKNEADLRFLAETIAELELESARREKLQGQALNQIASMKAEEASLRTRLEELEKERDAQRAAMQRLQEAADATLQEKEKLEKELQGAAEEREALQKQVEVLEGELEEARTAQAELERAIELLSGRHLPRTSAPPQPSDDDKRMPPPRARARPGWASASPRGGRAHNPRGAEAVEVQERAPADANKQAKSAAEVGASDLVVEQASLEPEEPPEDGLDVDVDLDVDEDARVPAERAAEASKEEGDAVALPGKAAPLAEAPALADGAVVRGKEALMRFSHESPDDIRLTGLLLHQEYRVEEIARLTRLDLERVKERLQHFLRHALIEIVEG